MIQMVTCGGRTMPAVTLSHVTSMDGVRELRDALNEVLETCLSSEENKDNTKAVSLWFLQQTITDLTQALEEGGEHGE